MHSQYCKMMSNPWFAQSKCCKCTVNAVDMMSHPQSLRFLHCSISFWIALHSHFSLGAQFIISCTQNLHNFTVLLEISMVFLYYSNVFFLLLFPSALLVCLSFLF